FTPRVSVATLSDAYSAATAAIGALTGTLPGGANERVFDMLDEIDQAGAERNYIQEKIDTKQKIMGFRHRDYRGGETHAQLLRE
ncbi:citrate/2-methylcitrate synthase, partial [Listeria monocytogenes]|uniref:citrate/2-methylcitrate synthase n=1 Tax=Listeria monocytogenes TaxID=1639 RepID=UPI0023E25D65